MNDQDLTMTLARDLRANASRGWAMKFVNDKTRLLLFLTLLASVSAYLADVYWVLELSSIVGSDHLPVIADLMVPGR